MLYCLNSRDPLTKCEGIYGYLWNSGKVLNFCCYLTLRRRTTLSLFTLKSSIERFTGRIGSNYESIAWELKRSCLRLILGYVIQYYLKFDIRLGIYACRFGNSSTIDTCEYVQIPS